MEINNEEMLTFNDVNAIIKKLGGDLGALRFLKGETIIREPSPTDFVVWKTIKLGTGLKAGDFRKAIELAGMRIDNGDQGRRDILTEAMSVSEKEIEIDLVLATGVQLGLGQHARIVDIIEKALKLGLEICPTEVGPQLRLQYTDQPHNQQIGRLQVPVGPIPEDGGEMKAFVVEHWHKIYYGECPAWVEDYLVLYKRSHWYERSTPVIHNDSFVFVKPRK